MSNGSGSSVVDEWVRIARKDWRRAERNLKDRDLKRRASFFNNPWRNISRRFSLSTTGSFERFTSLTRCWMRPPNSRGTWRRTGACASAFPATTWRSVIRR